MGCSYNGLLYLALNQQDQGSIPWRPTNFINASIFQRLGKGADYSLIAVRVRVDVPISTQGNRTDILLRQRIYRCQSDLVGSISLWPLGIMVII